MGRFGDIPGSKGRRLCAWMAEMLAVQTVHFGVYGGPQGPFPNLRPYSSPKVNPVSVILKRSKYYLRIAQPHFGFARIIPLIPSFYLLNPLYTRVKTIHRKPTTSKASQWQLAIHLLESLRATHLLPDDISFNSAPSRI